jgi:hypothetical protein
MSEENQWIQTFSGRKFPLVNPDPEAIDIEDIAHALAMLCRFNGQCLRFYSVAEHSVHVSHEIDPAFALLGLMHDASEAYLGDVPTPLKKTLPDFKEMENKLMWAIAEKFGLPEIHSDDLKRADTQLLIDEKAVLMATEPEPWPLGAPAVKNPDRIKGWSPAEAKQQFLARFRELWAGN